MDELFDMGRHGGSGGGEEVGVLKAQFLAYQREHGAVQHLVFQVERHRGLLACAEILDIVLAAHGEGVLEELTLDGVGVVYLVHHAHVHLLPEAGYGRHAGGVSLAHGLLHL